MWGFIFAIIIGGVAGTLAARFMKADNSLILNIILGVSGSFILNIILGLVFGLWDGNFLWSLLVGFIGASGLIWAYREYQRRK